jgi:hypothetical protein
VVVVRGTEAAGHDDQLVPLQAGDVRRQLRAAVADIALQATAMPSC